VNARKSGNIGEAQTAWLDLSRAIVENNQADASKCYFDENFGWIRFDNL